LAVDVLAEVAAAKAERRSGGVQAAATVILDAQTIEDVLAH
jgi:hypothetical protein